MNTFSDMINSTIPFVPKVLASTLCGSIVGIEREYKGKAAGLRTMILICVGCTLFTIIAYHISPASDPGRVISTILTGVGFLGAGAIFKNEDKVVGVTTAAFIWVIAALGVLIGIGEMFVSIILTMGLLSLSLLLTKVENAIRKNKEIL